MHDKPDERAGFQLPRIAAFVAPRTVSVVSATVLSMP
jgi:hypothetical protein